MAEVKKNGFTLVEAIVVSVIVLALAAVAIPIYTSYVNGTRQDAVNNLAQTAAAAASSYYKKTGGTIDGVTANSAPLSLFYDSNKFSVVITGSSSAATEGYIGVTYMDVKSGNSSITTSVQFK